MQQFVPDDRGAQGGCVVRAQNGVLRPGHVHEKQFLALVSRPGRGINIGRVQEDMHHLRRCNQLLRSGHLHRLHDHSDNR